MRSSKEERIELIKQVLETPLVIPSTQKGVPYYLITYRDFIESLIASPLHNSIERHLISKIGFNPKVVKHIPDPKIIQYYIELYGTTPELGFMPDLDKSKQKEFLNTLFSPITVQTVWIHLDRNPLKNQNSGCLGVIIFFIICISSTFK